MSDASSLLEFKCPCCGGAVKFDVNLQKIKCPYCDSEIDMNSMKEMDQVLQNEMPHEMKWEKNAGGEWEEGEEENFHEYVCNSCGGTVIGDRTLAASKCPYCDNPIVMVDKLSGSLKPDYVIPFKKTKEDAIEAMKNHMKGKLLLPSSFKKENRIEEVKGLYVPFWLFGADAKGDVIYRATKVSHWSDSNYNYTKTDYFSVIRKGDVSFEHVPVDGSKKMPDDVMESIEPFVFTDAVEFQSAYFAGYMADRYDVSSDESVDRANERIQRSTEEILKNTVTGYSTVTVENSNIQLSNGSINYAMYPVWILNTKYKDKRYMFAMNGETGKFVGDLPIDWGKFWIFFFIFSVLGVALSIAIIYVLFLMEVL